MTHLPTYIGMNELGLMLHFSVYCRFNLLCRIMVHYFSGMVNGIGRWLVADVLGQHINPMFKGQAVKNVLDYLTLEDGTNKLPRNISKELPLHTA